MKNLSTVRTLFFFLFTLLYIHSSHAQYALTQGNNALGGGVAFRLQQHDDEEIYLGVLERTSADQFNMGFSTAYGRIVADQVMLGLRLRYSIYKSQSEHVEEDTQDIYQQNSNGGYYGAGIFVRWYAPITKKIGVYVEPYAGYSFNKTISDNYWSTDDAKTESESKADVVSISVSTGLYAFILDQLSIELKFGQLSWITQNIHGTHLNAAGEKSESTTRYSALDLDFVNEFAFNEMLTLNYFF